MSSGNNYLCTVLTWQLLPHWVSSVALCYGELLSQCNNTTPLRCKLLLSRDDYNTCFVRPWLYL